MSKIDNPKFVIVGGGLGGSLLATYLGRAGYAVDVHEMRGDPRSGTPPGGRSINLALSHRGICALEEVGLADEVLRTAVPMRGRMIHSPEGDLTFQPYGKNAAQSINSVSRAGLNMVLLTAAQRHPNVRLFFNERCTGVNLETAAVELVNTKTKEPRTAHGDIVVSADGAFSAVRRPMQHLDRFDYRQDYLRHGYKELTIPAGLDGAYRMEKNALHIWPRRSFMMIALPNEDGSFTCTLFWPFDGPNSFAAIKTREDIVRVFDEHFPDAVEHFPTLVDEYMSNPVGSLVTVRCHPWHVRDKVVLLGDACHAVVPFYGQGMNAAFEDVLVLNACMQKHRPNWEGAFEDYERKRKANVDALADLAIGHFIEMRDHTGSRMFLFKKKTERWLHKLFPKWYIPLYTMATFTRWPYTEAVARAKRQDRAFIVIAAALFILLMWILKSWL